MFGMVSKAAIEGKKQNDQGTHILKLWTHVRIGSTTGEEKMLRKWRAAGQRNSPYESICTWKVIQISAIGRFHSMTKV